MDHVLFLWPSKYLKISGFLFQNEESLRRCSVLLALWFKKEKGNDICSVSLALWLKKNVDLRDVRFSGLFVSKTKLRSMMFWCSGFSVSKCHAESPMVCLASLSQIISERDDVLCSGRLSQRILSPPYVLVDWLLCLKKRRLLSYVLLFCLCCSNTGSKGRYGVSSGASEV